MGLTKRAVLWSAPRATSTSGGVLVRTGEAERYDRGRPPVGADFYDLTAASGGAGGKVCLADECVVLDDGLHPAVRVNLE